MVSAGTVHGGAGRSHPSCEGRTGPPRPPRACCGAPRPGSRASPSTPAGRRCRRSCCRSGCTGRRSRPPASCSSRGQLVQGRNPNRTWPSSRATPAPTATPIRPPPCSSSRCRTTRSPATAPSNSASTRVAASRSTGSSPCRTSVWRSTATRSATTCDARTAPFSISSLWRRAGWPDRQLVVVGHARRQNGGVRTGSAGERPRATLARHHVLTTPPENGTLKGRV